MPDQIIDTSQVEVPSRHLSIAKYFLGLSAVLGWTLSLVLIVQSPITTEYRQTLSPELTYNYVRNAIWFHSEGKVRELRAILSQHNVNDAGEVVKIKSLIRSMLLRRTEVYTQELNQLNTPIVNVGDAYIDVFNFDDFLAEVLMISLNKAKSIDTKMIEVYEVMFVYQTEANNKLKSRLFTADTGNPS